MENNSIAIFPASGGIGGGTYRHLFNLIDAKKMILVARSPERVPEKYRAAGAVVRHGDYDQLSTLDHAFDGARYLNLISYASISHKHRFNVQKAAIDAAVKSGVTHVFYSSLGFAGGKDDTIAHVMKAHLDTEKYLAQLAASVSGFTYTVVRQGLYTESFPMYLAFLDLKNPPAEVKIPHDGTGPGISWVKRDELGEGTAHLISDFCKDPASFPYVNTKLLLSGPRDVSLEESVEIIGRVLGKDIKVRQVSVDEWATQDSVRGASHYLEGDNAKLWATAWDALKIGEGAAVTPHLRNLIGREPESFEKTISDLSRA
ncbi:hypothetical protein DIS24_g5236 [Lasiodiplodia hormozganensis]|uniref:NmrA-like domain-containing protein n=1 Tax=Lasiodiplodia hormozganensis TaxID=869390 RepID=A0AA39YLA2_9PEZI|nr:hypothetical protein DIS24_g5236 [Lasiodiplodia hormozganensis]